MLRKMQKGNIAIVFLTVILVLLLVGLGAYYYSIKKPVIAPALEKNVATASATPTDETSNWKMYTNSKYKISFKYPSDWLVIEGSNNPSDPSEYHVYLRPASKEVGDSDAWDVWLAIYKSNSTLGNFAKTLCHPEQCEDKSIIDVSFESLNAKNIYPIGGALTQRSTLFQNKGYIYRFTIPQGNPGNSDEKQIKELEDQILSTFTFLDQLTPGNSPDPVAGRFCGGIAANLPQNKCPAGYFCSLDGNYPDASGKCVREKSD